ncbi:doublecortin domain-containing protein [Heterostelium album PN500]|uniref:Doublecortin domain-containing protein n=1 Tax=Heterostelium pallidum (strain ATCC 26659 / Pp 5 / PN500) TaxID=670386 RepID=D3BKU2_HETP5|nr:doublecortin domain-containing protein [Heterostelium album PN500]EFA78522.1 doublecortin domain-containing protein [Heterostelium album PN500]|eukprot:XP_020430646.1 doublecortin domain-containing protein [Heterostelium album PN500]
MATTTESPAKKMSKFGVQTEKGKVIHAWRNADKYQVEGVRIVIHSTKYKTYDQLKVELSQKVGLYTGAVQRVYSTQKKLIKGLEDFEDNQNYICCGAEKLSEDIYPKGLIGIFVVKSEQAHPSISTAKSVSSEPSSGDHSTSTTSTTSSSTPESSTTPTLSSMGAQPGQSLSRRTPSPGSKKPVVSSYKDGVPKKFAIGTDKAKVILAFRNGDKVHSGEKITIHSTKYRTYDQLKEHLSKQVGLVTGPVRKVYSFDGKQVKALEDFVDGQNYICCGGEPVHLETTYNVPAPAAAAVPASHEDGVY